MGYEITAIGGSERAKQVFDKAMAATEQWLTDKYANLESLRDMTRTELTSTGPIDQIPLFSGLGGFAVASADFSDSFSPAGVPNSGRGPQGRA